MDNERGISNLSKLASMVEHTRNLGPSVLVSATYDGDKALAVLKFYEPNTQRIHIWYDNTGHKPYCYSKLPPDQLQEIKSRPDIVGLKVEEKKDLLRDTLILPTRIIAKDPLAIGGSSSEKSVRNVIEAWEADIKYYENFLYDSSLVVGAFYEIRESKIIQLQFDLPTELQESLKEALEKSKPDFKRYIVEWANLLTQPLPAIKRAALDIEVASPVETRIPDPREAQHQVLAVSMVGSDGMEETCILKREGHELGENTLDPRVRLRIFNDEKELITEVFETMLAYPFIITFNGDDFDLNYLYHRAGKLGIPKEINPIVLGKEVAYLKHGVHIDLYKTFINRSMQIYAFNNKYTDHTLNGVSEGLLGESKIEFEGALTSLPLYELAKYNHNDALLTYRLTGFNDHLLMKLLLVIARIGKMPIDDVARIGVSNWIRSMIYFEHRRLNALIPKREELQEKGGATSEAIIKGKKYKGGLVVEPKFGVHFNVSVLDFASLYPSIIKVHNISYETVMCVHDECKSNVVPETQQWICTRRRGIASLLVGSLRDLRVYYYKPLSKSGNLDQESRALFSVVAQALKVILNASYGVMGAEIFPLYCVPVAEATASLARHVITRTIDKCKELGIEVVYGDTDSLFLESPSQEQIDAVSEWAERELGIELDLEKTYRYVAFSGRKKNYLGVLPDRGVDIKGLTGKKSHTPSFVKKTFYDAVTILSRVESPKDFERAREEIKQKVRERYVELKERRIPLEDLAFHVMIGKPPEKYIETVPQHIKAAQLLMKQGKEIRAGDIISFVKTSTPTGVKPVSMARIDEVDTAKYLDYLRSTFDQVLDALGYEFDEILGSTKLEDFFWES